MYSSETQLISPQAIHALSQFVSPRFLDSPFDLERCGPAIDLGLERINKKFLAHHKIYLNKVQARYEN